MLIPSLVHEDSLEYYSIPWNTGDNPLQYSCPRNPTDREDWRATIHGVTKSWTQFSHKTTTMYLFIFNCLKGILVFKSFPELLLIFFFLNLVVDLQHCISFRCPAKWFSYTCIYSFSNSFLYTLLQSIEYRVPCTVFLCVYFLFYV